LFALGLVKVQLAPEDGSEQGSAEEIYPSARGLGVSLNFPVLLRKLGRPESLHIIYGECRGVEPLC